MQSSELQAQEEARAAELLERLLTDAEFRAAFRMDPAGACAAFDLPELAEEFSAGAGAGKALHTLEIRESRSSLAGAFMAAASEGTGAVDHLKNLHDQHLHGGAHRVVHKALTSPRLAAVDPHHLHSGGAGVHELVDSSAGGASRGGGAAVHLASTQEVQALLHNSHVQLSPEAHAALVRGGADVRLVGTLDELAKDHQLRIGTLHVGKEGTGSFEILSVDGERVSETNIAARDLANELASLDPSLRPANIITPWPIAGEGFSTSGLHEDRIQIVFGAPAAGGHAVAAAPVLDSSTAAPAPLSDPVAPPPEPSTPATPTTTAPPSTPPPTPTTPPPADTGTPPPEPSTPAAPPADTSTPPPPPAPTTPPPVAASAPPPPVDPEPAAAPPPADTGTPAPADPAPADPAPADTGTPPPAAPAPADTGTPPPAAPGTPPPAPAAPPPPAPAPPPVPTTPAPTAPDAGAGPPPEPATPPAAPTTPPPEPVTPVTAPAAGPSHQSLVIGAVPAGSDPGHSTLQFQIPDAQSGGAGGGAALVGAFDPNAPGGLPDASDAYPGDDAGKEAIAAWMGRQAHKAGLPAELPIMAALTESGLTNVNYGDRDSLGFFQMRTSIWDQGEYKGFADHPELQLKWFIDHAVAVRRQAVERGDTNFGQDKSRWGDWVADVERPAAEYRYRYATHLAEADGLLAQAGAAGGTTPGADPSAVAEAFGGAAVGGSAVGVQALMIAEKFKGTPYHWGGASPETGFDCSGLVQYSYHQLGIDLPRVTTGQFGVGVHVPTVDQLKPGDIVFFKDSTGYIHHEGIYIGNHMFLHAPHTGDVIKVSSLDEPYYAQQFAGGSDVSGLATGAVPPAGVVPPVTPPVEPATPAPPDAADAGSSEPGSGDSGLFGAVPDSGKSSGGTRSTVQILPAVEDPNAPSDD